MELFTSELVKHKQLGEKLTKKCELLETEVNFLNKLLFFEQKFSDHLLNEVFSSYDKIFSDYQKNYRYFDAWDLLVKQKSIAKQNEIEVKKLRQELKTWRQTNNRLNIQSADHTYSSGTDSMTQLRDKSVAVFRRPVPQSVVTSKGNTTSSTSKDMTPEVIIPELSVKLEVIPKTEPEDRTEETDSASEAECFIEGVEPRPPSPQTTQPFLFVSEYLSKNKAFSHLMDKTVAEESGPSAEDNTIAIDLNVDSDEEDRGLPPNEPPVPSVQPKNSIFNDNVVDLTPKVSTPKKSTAKTHKKRKNRYSIKRKAIKRVAKSRETTANSTANTSNSDLQTKERIIGSRHKKIHFNADNTISIIEIGGSPAKRTKPEERANPKEVQQSPTVGPSVTSRQEKRKINENIIKSTKKIVLKGQTYYCRWSGCSYSSTTRSAIIRHSWSHTGETPFQCEVCPKGFKDKRHLTHHLMTHNASVSTTAQNNSKIRGTGEVICPECRKRFQNFQSLLKHTKRIHGLEKAENFRQQYYKQKNLIIRGQTSPVEVLKSKNSSVKVKSNTSTTDKSPKPRVVSTFRSVSPKKSNKKTETIVKNVLNGSQAMAESADEDKAWKCDFKGCVRSYTEKFNLRRHQMECHKRISKPLFYQTTKNSGKNYRYFIPKDSQSVVSPSKALKTVDSVKTTVHKSKPNLLAVRMAKIFQSSIAQHKAVANSPTKGKTKQSSVRQYVCPEPDCGSRFVWAKNLKTHLKDKHNIFSPIEAQSDGQPPEDESKQFQCTYNDCPFRASSRVTQVIHFKTHFPSDVKPFKCLIPGCSYSTKKLSELKNHVLNRHSEQAFFRAMDESGVRYPLWI